MELSFYQSQGQESNKFNLCRVHNFQNTGLLILKSDSTQSQRRTCWDSNQQLLRFWAFEHFELTSVFTFQQGNKWQSQNICGGKASIYIELIISLFTVCLMRLCSNQLNCWQAIGIVASLSFSADNSTGTVCGS